MNRIKDHNRWITNFQRLLARGVTDDDIVLVKLLTITNGNKFSYENKICSAHLIKNSDTATWHICDYIGSELLIPVKNDSIQLGSIIIENDDEENSKTIYIITSCYSISSDCSKSEHNYLVKNKNSNETIAYAETYREASNIAHAMKSCGVRTSTVYLNDKESDSSVI